MEKKVLIERIELTDDELTTLKKCANILADMADVYDSGIKEAEKVDIDDTTLKILEALKANIEFIIK